MIYMRGQAADYDGWRQLGLTGWGWDDVLPYFPEARGPRRAAGDTARRRAANGASSIRACAGTCSTRFAEAAPRRGIAEVDDFNSGDNAGVGLFPGEPEGAAGAGARRAAS